MTAIAHEKKAISSKRRVTGSSLPSSGKNAVKSKKTGSSSKEPKILVTIHNEHKYMSVLMKMLKEQLRNMKQNGDVDYSMMFDIMHYMNQFPDRFHHPREDLILEIILKKSSELKPVVEQLLDEHIQISKKGQKILTDLKSILTEYSDIKKARLQSETEDYIHALLDHINLEETVVFKKATSILNANDWKNISSQSSSVEDPLFGQIVEERYKNIYNHLTQQIDKAADDITLIEFIGIGALFESIGPIASGAEKISSILKDRYKKILNENVICYKSLLKASSQKKINYISKPISCMLDSYDYYVDGLLEIGTVLRETKKEIAEPYTTGLQLFEDIERNL